MSLTRDMARSVGLVLYVLLIVLLINGGKFHSLVKWDGIWFAEIVENGFWYDPLKQSTIAFFPAFPLLAKFVRVVTDLSSWYAPVLASQLASVGFFTYYYLILRRLGLDRPYRLAAWGWLLVQPAAFYFALPYAESLTCFSLAGFVYWTLRDSDQAPRAGVAAWAPLWIVAHGVVLGSTRIVGLALLTFPLLLNLCRDTSWLRGRVAPLLRSFGLALLSTAGFFAFLLYGQLKFGRWDIYWVANWEGWHLSTEAGKLLTLAYWRDVFITGNLPEMTGRTLTVITLVIGARMLMWAWARRADRPDLLAWCLLCAGFFFETVIGSHGMHAMIRYLIPIYAILLPLWMRYRQDRGQAPQVADLLVGGVLAALQALFIVRYSTDLWVS